MDNTTETFDQLRDRLFAQREADRAPLVAAVVAAQNAAEIAARKFGRYDHKTIAADEAEIAARKALLDHDHAAFVRDGALLDAALAAK